MNRKETTKFLSDLLISEKFGGGGKILGERSKH